MRLKGPGVILNSYVYRVLGPTIKALLELPRCCAPRATAPLMCHLWLAECQADDPQFRARPKRRHFCLTNNSKESAYTTLIAARSVPRRCSVSWVCPHRFKVAESDAGIEFQPCWSTSLHRGQLLYIVVNFFTSFTLAIPISFTHRRDMFLPQLILLCF